MRDDHMLPPLRVFGMTTLLRSSPHQSHLPTYIFITFKTHTWPCSQPRATRG